MEEDLLVSGEASGNNRNNDNNRRRRGPTALFRRRTDAITRGSPYQKAAALVDLKPLWCAKTGVGTYSCYDREYYYLGQLPYLTGWESLVYEGITLVILIIHTFFPITYEGSPIFWKSTYTRLKVLCLLILVADFLVYGLYLSPIAFDFLPLRIAPYIRVVFFILNIRQLRDTLFVLAGMLGTYLNVLALGLLFLLFSSWLAYVIFEDTVQGNMVFTSFGTTLYQMFVLFTTSNNPDVWIPAYKASRWYCLFFVLFVLIGVYFVTNLILAVVYDSFKSQLAKQVSEMDRMRRRTLGKAFNLIDNYNVGFLNKEQCIKLFEELNKYRTLPNISREEFELIFDELDDTHDFKINLDEFADLCNAIALRFQKEDVPSCFENLPSIYHSPFSEKLKAFIRSTKFGYMISIILIVNLVAVIVETTLDIQESSLQSVWQEVEFVFGWIYVLEMALKIYSYGFENYWRDGQNRFDFLVTWVIVIGETITLASPNGQTFLSNGEWIRYLLLARMLRLIRLLMHVQQYRGFVATFLTLIPSLMPYLGTIFCVQCIYCSLGVQIFGGIVNAGNAKLEETDLADDDYLLFNFNDYPNGMVTLFNLLVMGNWQVWMQSYKELTGTAWTLAYFVSFYLITVLLLLNLVIAFVLEAFFAEMELESSEKCEEEDKDGEPRERRRRVGTKTRSQRVDVLLHHMLSAELQKSCDS
ncbi:hypothetical protein CICLE_v10014388mg [Citrus x clementina]|uniref:EF-hand domain-containing protein n=1 Tax=Citrus clementina TaxID=85681 RepID=V4W3I1_CITCL|nr:hypothetical protein CICLE_v10014388mg [Citrus x clementina]